MKTGIMILKATLVITIFTGVPHLVAHLSGQTRVEPITYYDYTEDQGWDSNNDSQSSSSPEDEPIDRHPLIGYWYVTYEELEVGVTYEFREEESVINAYSIEVYDKDENKMDDNTLAMTIKSFDTDRGKADYFIEYEGEKYEVESALKLIGNKLEISYSYYGYEGKEVWEKVTK